MATQQPFNNTDLFLQPLLSVLLLSPWLGCPVPSIHSGPLLEPPSPPSTLSFTQSQKLSLSLHCLLKYEICLVFRIFPTVVSFWLYVPVSPKHTLASAKPVYLLVLAKAPSHTFHLWSCFISAWKSSSSLHTTWIKSRGLSWSYPPLSSLRAFTLLYVTHVYSCSLQGPWELLTPVLMPCNA